MKVLVCGGRDFTDKEKLYGTLDACDKEYGPLTIITGGARGADTLAYEWARENKRDVYVYPAHWEDYGRAAGPIRNKKMLDVGKPDQVLAFPGGRGTANMVKIAREAGVPVIHAHKTEKRNNHEQA